jgi:NADH-quinone oxidoreductase chain G
MTLKIKIDGREAEVEQGVTVLEAASQAGVHVPHLCYHSELSQQGSCRVCLVEVEGTPKLQPACSTAVCEGMVVRTDSPGVREARAGVLELLALNHPLDCPVCDKGGECKLQDYVFKYGRGRGRFTFEKRTFPREDIGPFVVRDMNRCIHCTRCVRFAHEVILTGDLGVFGRGDETSIGTYLGRELRSPFSGNVTELCPVGALTDRVFRFKARAWELENVPSVCPLCPVGCLTELQLDNGRVARIRGREGGASPWICDLGRFGFETNGLRQRRPFIKEDGREVDVPWDVALGMITGRFRVISKESGPESVGVLCSTRSTNEELFGLQYVLRNVLGSNNIDFRVRSAAPVSQEEAEVLTGALDAQGRVKEIENCDSILLVGADPCEETPLVGLHVGRAVASGAQVVSLGPRRASGPVTGRWLPATPEHSVTLLASLSVEVALRAAREGNGRPDLLKNLEELGHFSLERAAELTGTEPESLRSLVDVLVSSKKLGLVVGAEVFESPSIYLVLSSVLRLYASRAILGAEETILLSLLGQENVRGALELGAFPASHESTSPAIGMSTDQMIEAARAGKLRALLVFGSDPLAEYADRDAAEEALRNVEFLVVQSERVNVTAGVADVYVPLQSIFEREGSVMTLDGTLRALCPQKSELGKRSLLFDVLDSLSQTMGEGPSLKDATSTFGEMCRVNGWDCPENLEQLAAGSGLQIASKAATPSDGWVTPRGFEKDIRRAKTESDTPDYPSVLITGPVRVSSWIWARPFSDHELVPKEDVAEIPLSDARTLGIAGGDTVEIESPSGSVRVRAALTENLMPGTVFLPRGLSCAPVNLLVTHGEPTTKVRLRKLSA